ncbi:SPOR domain-containing protein [Caulobacter sp. 602-2]|uniref:SPOR domain-containing protein n=1 Tax=Caulobacter sp. 602-2 TaxID=2710887 RepID=A0A6G4R2Q0_9CAUL|nr:SPOR domain-containing protein [Caulobacter sp. 602-2]NGM52062.1 SPOR domain-containing protein [Caulobacter sp. 602-2]
MSDPHRGAYAPPTDAPLSFDARQPVRGSRPLPLTLIISAVVLGTLLVAVFLIYRNGIRGPNEPPRTVGEPVAEMKAAPAPDQNKPDEAAGLQIYSHENPTASPTYAAPPEEPMARPTAPPPAAPVQSASLPPAKPAATAPSAPVAAPPAAKPAAKPAPAPSIESLATAAVAPPKPAPVAAPKPAAAASGPASVQIGALSSTALADKAWNDAARIAPGLAAGKGKKVEAIDKNGSTLYRTSVTGFSSRADAKAFCDALSAAGKSCFVK